MKRSVPASAEMREYFGFAEMAHPDDVRDWFEGLWKRQRFAAPAVEYFRTLRLEMGTLDGPRCTSSRTRGGSASARHVATI